MEKVKQFDDFTTQIQSDELTSLSAKSGGDWINDFEEADDDDEYDND